MRVLVVGNGAREHALVWKLSQSPRIERTYCAPGNAGTASLGLNLPLGVTQLDGLAAAAEEHKIDLTVVGPEAPLDLGIVDLFRSRGLQIFGPTRSAARLEGSKGFARDIMQKYGIPCARGATFSVFSEALQYVRQHPVPLVIKADGLAAGKGVIIAETREQAETALSDIMEERRFGAAGDRVVVEECLVGKEVSLIAFTDGKTVIPLLPACDHKRAFDHDQGPNTGGMGCYSPPDFFGEKEIDQVRRTILEPAVRGMASEGAPYTGFLYAGLMATEAGIKVLEFNARLGDPEAQVLLPRLETDLLEVLEATVQERLHDCAVKWDGAAWVGVVLASAGYPGDYRKGFPISGWGDLDNDVIVFHAGTKAGGEGLPLTDGGRVLTVVGQGKDLQAARAKVYANTPRLHFEGCRFRSDIAYQS